MTEALFRDPELQARFDRDGSVTVELLDGESIAHLRAVYESLPPDPGPSRGFHVSMDLPDPDLVDRIAREIGAALGPALEPHLLPHRVISTSFVVKDPTPTGIVPPHQDWTFVDESRFTSATVWTPLVDTTLENGALGVIHGSHRFFDHVRNSPSPQSLSILAPHLGTLFPYLDVREVRAGEAIVFDNRLIHGSGPNLGPETRLAAGIGVTHRDAELVHHYLVPGTEPPTIESYRIEADFFRRFGNARLSQLYDAGARPEGLPVVDRRPFDPPSIDLEDLLGLVHAHPANRVHDELADAVLPHLEALLAGAG